MKFKELLASGRLDEISQAAKNAYIKGASKDLLKTKADHADRNEREQKALNRKGGLKMYDPDHYQDTQDEFDNWKKMDKRTRGVQKAVDKSMTTEGKFVEPFSASGKPNPNHPNFAKNKAKYDAEQKAEREANRPPKAAPKPKINLDQIFYDLSSLIGEFFPDGDPADYFPKYYRKHGIDYEIARKAFKKNGYEDEYDYIEQMKVDFPMNESVNSNIQLSDIGKAVLVRGKPGYNLLAITHSPGGLEATVSSVRHGGETHCDLADVSRVVKEGIVDTVKKGIKSVKRGMQGWGTFPTTDLDGQNGGPKGVVKRNKGYDDETVKSLSDFKNRVAKERPDSPHSPSGLQQRVLDREMKKRGLTKEEVDTEQTELAQQIKDLVAAGKDREANHLRRKLNNLIDMDRIRQKNKGMKEGYGGDNTFNRSSRADWDPNMTDYKGDYGGSKNWGHREREDDESHHLDKWYLRVNGQVYSRFGKPVAWDSRALANSYGHTLQHEHPDWKILLTQSPV